MSRYIPRFSEDLKREPRKLKVRVAFRKGRTLESILCRLKFREPFEKSKNNIYKGIAKPAPSYTLEKQININAEIEDIKMPSKLVTQTIVL